MRVLFLLFCGVLFASSAVASDAPQKPVKPEPAIGDFTSVNYPMTFKAPPNAFYCPLSKEWEGSDHGTTVFLAPPKACYGAGYPSSSRGFEPGDVPRIYVYYGYVVGEDAAKVPPCRSIGTAALLDKNVPLCRETRDGMTAVTANGRYTTDIATELVVSLVVQPKDVDRYLPVLKALLATAHSCTSTWDENVHGKKKHVVFGHGPPCPQSQWY